MKKYISIFVVAASLLIITGCVSTDRRLIFSQSPVAIVSVVANNDINWMGEEPLTVSSILSFNRTLRRSMEEDPDFVITTSSSLIIDEIEEFIRFMFASSPFVTLAPKETVLNSRSYNEARIHGVQEMQEMAKPAGFRYVFHRDNNFYPAFAQETGIERTLFITLNITKMMASGFGKSGNLRAHVSMNVLLKDSRGRNVFNKTYEAGSRGQLSVSSGAYSQSGLLALVKSALSDVCDDFLDDLAY